MFEHLQKTCHLIVITAAKPRGRLVRFLIAAERPYSCLCTSVDPDSPQKQAQLTKMVFDPMLQLKIKQIKWEKEKQQVMKELRRGLFWCAFRWLEDWRCLPQYVRHVCFGRRYLWLAQVTLPKFIMSVWPVFSDEIQPAGYPDPIKGCSQVSFSEPQKEKLPLRTHSHCPPYQ